MDKKDKAYIAGFIDGEGCITICGRNRKNGRKSFQPHICVTNTNKEVLEWMQKITGIGIVRKGYGQRGKWKEIYRWELYSNQVKELMIEVLPYLRIKKKVAICVVNFPLAKGGVRTEDFYNKQLELFAEVAIFNQRGISPEK